MKVVAQGMTTHGLLIDVRLAFRKIGMGWLNVIEDPTEDQDYNCEVERESIMVTNLRTGHRLRLATDEDAFTSQIPGRKELFRYKSLSSLITGSRKYLTGRNQRVISYDPSNLDDPNHPDYEIDYFGR